LPIINATVNIPRAKYQQEVQLDVLHNGILNYSWTPVLLVNNNLIQNPISIIKASTLFIVEVTDKNNCIKSDSIFLELIDECQESFMYLPSAFSPNNDGINDCFGIISPPVLSDYKLQIFDRWSEKVFESNAPDKCWDGLYKGELVSTDSYTYIVSYICYNGKLMYKKGTVSVIR